MDCEGRFAIDNRSWCVQEYCWMQSLLEIAYISGVVSVDIALELLHLRYLCWYGPAHRSRLQTTAPREHHVSLLLVSGVTGKAVLYWQNSGP